jgi:signal transduction histidine kinase
MKRNPGNISPSAMTLAARLLSLSLVVALWLQGRADAEGLILVLFLSILSLARWRFPRMPAWSVVFDQAACGIAMLPWSDAVFALAIPILDASVAGLPWLALPALAIVSAQGSWSIPLAAAFSGTAFLGWTLRLWSGGQDAARRDADRDRRERYDLESLKAELLSANIRSARMAEVAVRARLARDLHDHAGHELTAAHLALQAHARL